MKTLISPQGRVSLQLYDKDNNLLQEQVKSNLIVNTGLAFLANALVTASASPFSYIGVGTGTNAPGPTDTTLQTEVARVAISNSVTGAICTMVVSLGSGVGTGALTEAGVFNAASSGTMFSRVEFSAVNKAPSDTLVITWTFTVN
jgi:hypothetical protein